jgi:hypothetical protein
LPWESPALAMLQIFPLSPSRGNKFKNVKPAYLLLPSQRSVYVYLSTDMAAGTVQPV